MPRSSQSMAGDRARLKNGLKLSPKIQLPEGKRMAARRWCQRARPKRRIAYSGPHAHARSIRFGIADAGRQKPCWRKITHNGEQGRELRTMGRKHSRHRAYHSAPCRENLLRRGQLTQSIPVFHHKISSRCFQPISDLVRHVLRNRTDMHLKLSMRRPARGAT